MKKVLWVIDDALEAPTKFKMGVSRLDWRRSENLARGREARLPRARALAIGRTLSKAAGVELNYTPAGYCGVVRKTPASALKGAYRFKAHFEPGWNTLIYLNDNRGGAGGTGFFTHKRSRLDGLLSEGQVKSALRSLRWTLDDLIECLVGDELNPEKWIEHMRVSSKFNRAVIFDGLLFHSHLAATESGKVNARLTVNSYTTHDVDKRTSEWVSRIYATKTLARFFGGS